MLRGENLVKRYGDHVALDDVSLELPRAKVFGLLGPNGAGKTTLIRILTRITGPDSGMLYWNDRPMAPDDVRSMGYLPEERGLYKKMKVGEQALYLAQLKGMPKAEAQRRLKEWFERWEIGAWWNKKVEELSKGMAQKVQFITTVLHEPELLILDEPFSGFDPINAELVRCEILRLRNAGTTVMLSTHNMGSVEELCDHIALIDKSRKVLDGSVREVREAYSTRTYRMVFKGATFGFTNALWTGAQLLEHSTTEGTTTARVQLLQGTTLNQVVGAVLPHVELHGVQEEIPRMHDIFIRVVAQNDPQAITADMTE
jgi:ABC-2 type transport system ATP-binding protein